MTPKRTGNGTFVYTEIELEQGISGGAVISGGDHDGELTGGNSYDLGNLPNSFSAVCGSTDTFTVLATHVPDNTIYAEVSTYTPPAGIVNCCIPVDIGEGADFLYDGYIDITGVRLVAGLRQQPFHVMPYEQELEKCQRYFETNVNVKNLEKRKDDWLHQKERVDDEYMSTMSMPSSGLVRTNLFKFTYVIDDDIYETNNSNCV